MAEETPSTPSPTPSSNPHASLRADVATRLASSATEVRELVVVELTKAEIERRAAAVKVIITKVDEKQKDLQKAEKAGTHNYNAAGDKVGDPFFSKEQAEALKKLREEIGKYQSALTKAFDEGDFSKVLELGK